MTISRIELDGRPPVSGGSEAGWLRRSAKSAGLARQMLACLLGRVAGGERFAESGAVVVAELVSNAVRHGTRPSQLVWVQLEVDPVRLRIEVHDASSVRPVVLTAGVDGEHGRGLVLVDSLSHRWGCCPRRAGIGKIVWSEIKGTRSDL
ncbi:ATP-binding protein [Kitasatospora sp. NPDC052896]|uniref:ATP-binding protein n=1 Tax=Kitasatospora sp. NPDC052896 TaxID=3364061 RepID=UPI0037C5B738